MAPKHTIIPTGQFSDMDRRQRLSKLNVLLADRDHRTASLVQRILFSFGFRHMDVTTNGESALSLLRNRPYDIIITEWNMSPIDGVMLVKAIRNAREDERIRRDIPIIMLTARADLGSVEVARDAGITEFIAKPFSAKTISSRIIQLIDHPRAFVETENYAGPDRRRRGAPPPGMDERRGRGKKKAEITPANSVLQEQLGKISAAEIINEVTIKAAQADLLAGENEFLVWVRDDVARLEKAFANLVQRPSNRDAARDLQYAAYAIKSQAGIFGYPLGSEVAGLMVDYLDAQHNFTPDSLTVVRKHIDTIHLIFRENIKENGQGIAIELIASLKKLIDKLG